MRINISNYEAWFLDYHEGNLDAAGKQDLFAFLEKHPGLREEFESFAPLSLEAPDVKFPGRDSLRRTEKEEMNPSVFIAWHEGDLDKAGQDRMDAWLKSNPGKRKDFELYRKLKLLPDYTIVFKGKSKLKKTVPLIPYSRTILRYAAIVALLVATYVYFRDVPVDNPVAEVSAPQGSSKDENKGPASVPATAHAQPVNRIPKAGAPASPVRSKQQPQATKQEPIASALVPLQSVPPSEVSGAETHAPVKAVIPSPATSETIASSSAQLTRERLLEVFTPAELEEMGLAQTETRKHALWNIVEKGAEGVGKVTGTEVDVTRQPDESGRTQSYRFAIGNFSLTHSRAGQ